MTPKKLTIAVDVDDTVANLIGEWLRRYNRDWNDSKTPADITQWAISKCVKPECGTKILKYLEDADLYDDINPIEGALTGVDALRAAGHRVIFVTSCGRNASTIGRGGDKFEWLKSHGFFDGVADPYLDFIICADKTQVAADVIVDDRWDTIKAWQNAGRAAILVSRPHNLSVDAFAVDHLAFNWLDIVQDVLDLALVMRRHREPDNETVMMLPSGSAERKAAPIMTGVLDYFPLALAGIARISKKGNDKHNPGQPLNWARGKSQDHADCAVRHMVDRDALDPDTQEPHYLGAGWRILAYAQLAEEKRLGKPISRGSTE